jgi:hypothetical protein
MERLYTTSRSLQLGTSGPATFTATLTHYRTFLFGTCVTYFATVTGSLQRA